MTEFLQLTEFVNEEDEAHASSTAVSDSLRDRPGPTPATVKPVYHNTGALARSLSLSPPHHLDATLQAILTRDAPLSILLHSRYATP